MTRDDLFQMLRDLPVAVLCLVAFVAGCALLFTVIP